jgi:hypothetical protein
MATSKNPPSALQWMLMSEMEKSVWATTFALNATLASDAVQLADQAVEQLRSVDGTWRFLRPEPEYEAARAGHHIERGDFDIWYRIASMVRHGDDPSYRDPTTDECAQAYDRFQWGRSDFY